ncbi:zinc-ribbon domain-containing protein [Nocardioides scoriae]|uniref:Zinc-ribbon domain-containing protein n=1 Tax=Nocardioides scoriae TaxID=642780 RepID=A0A1H1NUP2_9ACTN|nr:FHA domain-containing protein [Nocardioides scoriae]SDS02698.1 zinc-ribbon domain-containing protein [Nocardioides scoriae]
MPFCSQCGHDNPATARFCSQCGTPLAAAAPQSGAPAGGEVPASDSTATITFGGLAKPVDDERASLAPADAAAVDALPAGSALLVVQRGPGAGSRYLLDTDLSTVGRHPESDIFLDDITVSRRHVEFRRTPEGFRVHDVGSLNGTYLNGDRVDEVVLQNGDEVRIGKFRLSFFASDAQVG